MIDEIPDWAIERALSFGAEVDWHGSKPWTVNDIRQDARVAYGSMVLSFARYIAAHEEEPVDPLVADAKDMAGEYYRNCETAQALALRALRRGIEIGRAENE